MVLKSTKGHNDSWLTIATGWFVAVVIGVFVAQAVGSKNADINPAITLAKYLLGYAYRWPEVIAIMLVQIAGCFTGGLIVWLNYLPHWPLTKDPKLKLSVFATTPAVFSYVGNLLSEIIGTIVLIIANKGRDHWRYA